MIKLSSKTIQLLNEKTDFIILGDGKDDIDVKDLDVIQKQCNNLVSIGITSHE
jgi:hypothetical protein